MKQKHKRIPLSLVLFATFLPTQSLAYPIWINVENNRAHSLYVMSPSEKIQVEIAPKEKREFKISDKSDYRVCYRSGPKALATGEWCLNSLMDDFITVCARNMGDAWKTKSMKYCSLRLDEVKAPAGYTLTVTEIRDLKLPYDEAKCKFSDHELAQKLCVISKTVPLLSEAMRAASSLLYQP